MFVHDESGTATPYFLVMMVLFLGAAGIAVDGTNAYRMRTMLQVTADAASHAAATELARQIVAEVPIDADAARQAAYLTAERNLRFTDARNPVELGDIEFGTWDVEQGRFVPGDPQSLQYGVFGAVRVVAQRRESRDNALPTHLLRIIGFDSFNVDAVSISALARPPCINNGIIAYGRVRLTSNVNFGEHMCVHGQEGLSTRNNLVFGQGSKLSAPDIRHVTQGGMLDVPSSSFDHVQKHSIPGSMTPAMAREDVLRRRINMLRDEISGADGGGGHPAYKKVTHGSSSASAWNFAADYAAGFRKFDLKCTNSQNRYEFPNLTFLIEDVTIVSTCSIKSNGALSMKNVVFAVDNTSTESIFLNGKTTITTSNTDCAEAGNFVAATTGGINFTAQQSYANTELFASRGITYTAGGDTNYNVAIESWTDVSMTANGKFTNCPSANPYSLAFKPQPRIVGTVSY